MCNSNVTTALYSFFVFIVLSVLSIHSHADSQAQDMLKDPRYFHRTPASLPVPSQGRAFIGGYCNDGKAHFAYSYDRRDYTQCMSPSPGRSSLDEAQTRKGMLVLIPAKTK